MGRRLRSPVVTSRQAPGVLDNAGDPVLDCAPPVQGTDRGCWQILDLAKLRLEYT